MFTDSNYLDNWVQIKGLFRKKLLSTNINPRERRYYGMRELRELCEFFLKTENLQSPGEIVQFAYWCFFRISTTLGELPLELCLAVVIYLSQKIGFENVQVTSLREMLREKVKTEILEQRSLFIYRAVMKLANVCYNYYQYYPGRVWESLDMLVWYHASFHLEDLLNQNLENKVYLIDCAFLYAYVASQEIAARCRLISGSGSFLFNPDGIIGRLNSWWPSLSLMQQNDRQLYDEFFPEFKKKLSNSGINLAVYYPHLFLSSSLLASSPGPAQPL